MTTTAPTIRADIPVRHSGHDLSTWFDDTITDLTVGAPLGGSDQQGAYERWAVYQEGTRVGTLFDDAHGLTYDAVDDDGQPIF